MTELLARRDAALAGGARQVGWKIGFNTPAIQHVFGLTQPVVGYLVDTGEVEPGGAVSLAGWAKPAVEVELAVRVGDDGGVAGLAPALEFVDLDIAFDDIEPVLSGNICHRSVMFGSDVPGVDPWSLDARVVQNGIVVATDGRLSEDPVDTVAFVRAFVAAHGATLESGQRIIAGSVVPPVAVAPGDELEIAFGPLGTLRVRFY
jgi:2-keto-4-pentenoate hydratase